MAPPERSARISPPPPLNTKKGASEWKLFKQMWGNYVIVARLQGETADYMIALFLHTLGTNVLSSTSVTKEKERA